VKRTPSNMNAYLLINLVLVGLLLIGIWRGQAPFDTVVRLPSLLLILVIINTILIFRDSIFPGGNADTGSRAKNGSRFSKRQAATASLRAALNSRSAGNDATLPADALGTLLGISGQSGMCLFVLDESGSFARLAACGAVPPQISSARFILQGGELCLRHPAGLGDEMLCRWGTAPRAWRHDSAVTVLSMFCIPLIIETTARGLLVSIAKADGPSLPQKIDPETCALFLESALARWQTSIRAAEGRALDPQTGLQQVECFKEAFETEVERSERYHQNLTLMLVDLAPCDDLLPAQRDALRQAVSAALRDSLRRLDQAFVCSRPGRFSALLTETTSDVASLVTDRIRQAFSIRIGDLRSLQPRLAIGTASYPADATHGEGLREKADEALAEAIRCGKPVVAYESIHSCAADKEKTE